MSGCIRIVDTVPLIFLAKLGQLELLQVTLTEKQPEKFNQGAL
ncbi:MAG: hypothetical protein ABIG63_14000 [Chloroflexota bacterium]